MRTKKNLFFLRYVSVTVNSDNEDSDSDSEMEVDPLQVCIFIISFVHPSFRLSFHPSICRFIVRFNFMSAM